MRAALRIVGGAALLGLGLMAGLGVTRSEAEERTPLASLGEPRHRAGALRAAPAPLGIVRLLPANARAELDGIEVGHGGFVLPARDEALHQLRVSAPGYVTRVVLFRGAFPESAIALAR